MRILFTLPLALALLAPAAAAQAPRITESGDPSVRSDTIYRLAVRPEDHPDEDAVLLLDDGVVVLNADGTDTRTYRYVAQVLTHDAVEAWAERTFSYDGTRQRLRLNWARVVGLDGRVISDRPSHDQESLAPVSQSAPVYTDQKVRRISMGGVAPGVIVDYSYTIENVQPTLPGDFHAFWSVHTSMPVRRSRYVVEVPATLDPRIDERNLGFRRRTTRAGGAVVYEWATSEVPDVEPEPYMATDSNRVFMTIALGGRTSWADVARWYHGLSADRYALTPAIEAKVAEVVRGAATREDSLRAVHRWIAQDFRYVSLSLGIGGYQPRTPESVFQTQYGDCKDKATLFIAVARRMGVAAHPVLLASEGGVDRAMPSVDQFDHMIAAVERPGGGYTYLDLTAALTPYGAVIPSYQGEFALVVKPDGSAEEVTLPLDPPSANRVERLVSGELAPDGTFRGSASTRTYGGMQYRLRDAFSSRLSPRQRDEVARGMAQGVFEGASADSLEVFDGRDLRAQPLARVWVSGARAASQAGEAVILHLPLASPASPEAIAELEAAPGPRRFDIDAGEVVGPVETVSELRVLLPKGWRARLPRNTTASSAFGTYTAEYSQVGRELRVVRRMTGARGRRPAAEAGALLDWLKAISRDEVGYVVLDRPRT